MHRVVMIIMIIVALCVLSGSSPLPAPGPQTDPITRFTAVDVSIVCADDTPLAAYQVELTATDGRVRIVGIEGGDHAAFADAPYYDPAAIQGDRVILAAFSTAAAGTLPRGTVRVATLHVRVSGDAACEFDGDLAVAATVDGRPIPAELLLTTDESA